MKRTFALLFQLLFSLPFILFLFLIVIEQHESFGRILFLITITLLIGIGLMQKKFYKINFQFNQPISIVLVVLGCIATYTLHYQFQLNAILAAGIVGFIGAITEKKSQYLDALPIYCGAFVGMTNPENHYPFYVISLIGFYAGMLYYISKNFYAGIGGKLGTIAFSSVLVVIILYKYFKELCILF